MSQSNRLSYLVGALGVLLLILGNYVSFAEPDNEFIPFGVETKPGKDQSRPHAETDSSASKHDKQQPTAYKPNCQKPKDAGEADLCEQGRMARAAEDLLKRTDTQIELSKFEIGGLLLTLIFTGVAAVAAVAAARSARAAVAVANETAKKQLRAYVVVKNCKLRYVRSQPIATVTIINCGQTPATNLMMVGAIFVDAKTGFYLLANFDENLSKGRLGRDREFVLDATKKTRMTVEQIEGLKKGTHTLIVTGDIEYTDIFGDVWVQKYEFCTGGKYGKAVRKGLLAVSSKKLGEHKKEAP